MKACSRAADLVHGQLLVQAVQIVQNVQAVLPFGKESDDLNRRFERMETYERFASGSG